MLSKQGSQINMVLVVMTMMMTTMMIMSSYITTIILKVLGVLTQLLHTPAL